MAFELSFFVHLISDTGYSPVVQKLSLGYFPLLQRGLSLTCRAPHQGTDPPNFSFLQRRPALPGLRKGGLSSSPGGSRRIGTRNGSGRCQRGGKPGTEGWTPETGVRGAAAPALGRDAGRGVRGEGGRGKSNI